ncbi:cytochrome c biogenesis CcdA family protein [Streptomyces sp. NPDC059679]|uniref:cytochrome c biogenesis CcdA family protein n=1 Tax=Streptomyces sp. NPDC059679 TaxID=3346903 RepID=UPI00368435BB
MPPLHYLKSLGVASRCVQRDAPACTSPSWKPFLERRYHRTRHQRTLAARGAAGAASFFSPCCLPLVPGYLSYATGMSADDVQDARPGRGRMVAGTALFILGFSALFASYGYAGNVLLENQERLTQILGALTIVLGLLFLGAFERIPIAGRTFRIAYHPRAGLAGAPLLG